MTLNGPFRPYFSICSHTSPEIPGLGPRDPSPSAGDSSSPFWVRCPAVPATQASRHESEGVLGDSQLNPFGEPSCQGGPGMPPCKHVERFPTSGPVLGTEGHTARQ